MAAVEIASRDPKVGIITIEVARPDFPVVDRSKLSDSDILAARKGFYVIKDFDERNPKQGYVIVQGSSSTNGLILMLDKIRSENINVKVIAAISEELFDRQPDAYKKSVLPNSAYYDMMIISTGTKRMWPISNVGPLTEEYSLTSDWNDQWLSGGSEAEVLREAQLDPQTIFESVKRFATDHNKRIEKQTNFLKTN
jgi:transketolase